MSKFILIAQSVGDVIDKLTILQIKNEKIKDRKKLTFIKKEITYLRLILSENNVKLETDVIKELLATNSEIWETEQKLRDKSISKAQYIEAAQNNALLNDKRFILKQKLNKEYECDFQEQKSYQHIES